MDRASLANGHTLVRLLAACTLALLGPACTDIVISVPEIVVSDPPTPSPVPADGSLNPTGDNPTSSDPTNSDPTSDATTNGDPTADDLTDDAPCTGNADCAEGESCDLDTGVCSPSATGVCGPDAGNCYLENFTPGCQTQSCCDVVCSLDWSCCSLTWDQDCAEQALRLCPLG